MPLFFSCGDPSGNPKNDAENMRGYIEKSYKHQIEFLEKKLEVAQYYAQKDDPEGYEDFLKELTKKDLEVHENFNDDHEEEIEKINDRLEDAEEDMMEKRANEKIY